MGLKPITHTFYCNTWAHLLVKINLKSIVLEKNDANCSLLALRGKTLPNPMVHRYGKFKSLGMSSSPYTNEYMTGILEWTSQDPTLEPHAISTPYNNCLHMLLKSLGLLLRQIFNNGSSSFQNTWNHASWNILEIHTRFGHSWTAGYTHNACIVRSTRKHELNYLTDRAPAYR